MIEINEVYASPTEARLRYIELKKKGVRCFKTTSGTKYKRYTVGWYERGYISATVRDDIIPHLRPVAPRNLLEKNTDDKFKDWGLETYDE